MTQKPNIILIMTDQQRLDTIGALGAPWMRTPTLDRLVETGTAFLNCFITSPVCVTSRASVFQGMYPHSTGIFNNFQPWSPNWVGMLADAGYHCVNIGKMHINPYGEMGGFHQRFVVENKDRPLFLDEHDRAFYDEWDKALHSRGLAKPSRYSRYQADPEGYREALGCFVWDLEEDMHPDFFVGDMATWWIEDRKTEAPLFLQIGFPGPHPPYDPVARYLEAYRDVEMPAAQAVAMSDLPVAQQKLLKNMIDFNFDSVAWKEGLRAEEVQKIRRHYAANVTMIDEKIGQILGALERKGYLDDAIIIFTSDHGDALGDYGHIQKWTMYDSVTRVPLIVCGKGIVQGRKSETLVQLMDIAPTVLDWAGVATPERWEARSFVPTLATGAPHRDVVFAELAKDHIQTGADFIVMRRDAAWKAVWYMGMEDGELYDLNADPNETRNLWASAAHRTLRDGLVEEIKQWLIRSMLESRAGSSRRPQAPMRTEI